MNEPPYTKDIDELFLCLAQLVGRCGRNAAAVAGDNLGLDNYDASEKEIEAALRRVFGTQVQQTAEQAWEEGYESGWNQTRNDLNPYQHRLEAMTDEEFEKHISKFLVPHSYPKEVTDD